MTRLVTALVLAPPQCCPWLIRLMTPEDMVTSDITRIARLWSPSAGWLVACEDGASSETKPGWWAERKPQRSLVPALAGRPGQSAALCGARSVSSHYCQRISFPRSPFMCKDTQNSGEHLGKQWWSLYWSLCIKYSMLLRHNFLITLCWILSLQKIVIINLWSKFATTKLYWEYNIVTRLQLLILAQEAHKSFDQDYRLASNCKWIFNNVSLIFLPATYSFIYQLQILPIVENNFSHCQFHRGNNRLGVPHSSRNRIHLSET